MDKDIYFNKYYGKLYEEVENGKLESFELVTEYGAIEYIFIKREIDGYDGWYDIVTPYGYGGPLVTSCKNKGKLIKQFEKEFGSYCKEHNIVSEFVRFHPIYRNALDFKDVYDVEFSRKTIGTNLKDYDDPISSEFSKSIRKEIRKAENNGVEVKTILNPISLNDFKRLYKETMDRNNADDYYYFSDEYYKYILKNLGEYLLEIQLLFEGIIIASEIYFVEGKIMHAHLLGSSDKMLTLNAGALLEGTAARWGKKNGYDYIHHGGGRTSSEEDSLYLYKKKYGKNTNFDFYIGKKIWNEEVYNKIVEAREKILGRTINKEFFPKYRAE